MFKTSPRQVRHPFGRIESRLSLTALLLCCAGPALAEDPAPASGDDDPVSTITIRDRRLRTGTEADGYRVDDFVLGPLGDRPVLDLPYAVQTVPQDLIQSQQVDSNLELLKYLPSTQIEFRGGSEVGRPQSRGFEADLMGNTRIDGFAVQSHIPQPIELTDHIDVLSGLSGAYYGPMNPAGVFNYVLKRPTEETFLETGLAFQSDGNLTERLDAGGRIGADKIFGYRLNLAHTDGETFTSATNLRREVMGLALDARVTPETLIEVNAGHYIYDRKGYPGSFKVPAGANAVLPDPLDGANAAYGYDWADSEVTIGYYGARVTRQFGENWNLTGGVLRQEVTRIMRSVGFTLTADGTAYKASASESFNHWETTANQLYLNGKVFTGSWKHNLVLGTNGYYNPGFAAENTGASSSGSTCSIDTDTACAITEPAWNTEGAFHHTGIDNTYQTAIVGDTIDFNEQWSLLGVFSNGWIHKDSATAGRETDMDDAHSWTTGLTYKPRQDMSLYANYSRSVNPDPGQAPATAANANEFLDPYESKQAEIGWKWSLSTIDLNLAAFRIERPIAYVGTDNVFEVQGNQRNNGVETMVRGRVTEDITLFGGVTWLDTKVSGTGNAATDGLRAVGVPEWQANLLTEYRLPQTLIPDTTASLNLHYTGERPANSYNTTWADDYVTVDVGLRYSGDLAGQAVTARLGVNNLFDEHYWASIFPGSIDNAAGSSAGSTAFLGEPRTYKVSLGLRF